MIIGINFPTNIGDTILALPVLDVLRGNFPSAKITAISSSKTRNLLSKNNFIDEVVLFDKNWTWKKKMYFSLHLRGKFDVFVDLKNSFLPLILKPKRTTPFLRFSSKSLHKRIFYLSLIKNLVKDNKTTLRSRIVLSSSRMEEWRGYFSGKDYLFIGLSSASSLKSYPPQYLKELISRLNTTKVVLLGGENDKDFYQGLEARNIINLVAQTEIEDVFFLLENYARLLLTVDCSLLHIGSYLNIPVVALFGPTPEKLFGPYSQHSLVLKREDLRCRPCQRAQCKFGDNQCMKIPPQEVIKAISEFFKS